jgi:hypothetical protein
LYLGLPSVLAFVKSGSLVRKDCFSRTYLLTFFHIYCMEVDLKFLFTFRMLIIWSSFTACEKAFQS